VKADGLGGAGAPALPAPAHDKRDSPEVAARQLEAFFLRRLLAEARPQGGGMLDGGFAGDTFKQMMDEAIADKMSAAGGIGMAKMFAKQLGATGEIAGAATPAPPIANLPPGSPGALGAPGSPGGSPGSAGGSPLGSPGAPPDLPAGIPAFVLPVSGRPSSGYGLRADPVHGTQVNHRGLDVAAPTGTAVAAAARGTVVHAGPAGTYGNLVTLRHDNGFETRYAHLSAVDVKVGDQVEAGAGVGKVGSTGHSTGPHLHFEVRHDGVAIDPAPHLPLNRSPVRTTR
jgi:murein DD-endopeptidase MepM/ murein hydrolase activator NlpD